MDTREYQLLVESLRSPRLHELRPIDRPCAPPDAAGPIRLGEQLAYTNQGPVLAAELFEPVFENVDLKVVVVCAIRAARMVLPLWNEWMATVVPFIPETEEGFDAPRWRPLPYYRDQIEEVYNRTWEGHQRPIAHWSDPPGRIRGTSREFVLWILDWPSRLLRQADEWVEDHTRPVYPGFEAGTIFNTLREYLIRDVTLLAARDTKLAGWDSLEMSVRGLATVFFWLARALSPLPDTEHREGVIRNDTLHCISSCATAIAWRVDAMALRSMDHGMTRRVFSEPRGELIPACPGRFTERPAEVEQRTRDVISGFYSRWWGECRCSLPFREGTSVTLEGPREEAYDPYPKPPENFTTVNLIEKLGFGQVDPVKDLLGVGGFGEAWQLPDGSVLKFTTSPAEMHCVEYVHDHDLRSTHLPRVIDYGEIEPGTAYWHSGLHEDDDRLYHDPVKANQLRWQGWGPTFWYAREALNDVRPSDAFDFRAATIDLWTKHGILPMDIDRISNWGKRPVTGALVLRDLACSTPEEHFANVRRTDTMVQYPAELHPSDVPSFLADRIRGGATTGGAGSREKVVGTRQLIGTLGFRLAEGRGAFLGAGSYGEAWRLANGHVLKLTGSEVEIQCARGLLAMKPQPVEVAHIYQAGEIPSVVGEVHVWTSNQPRTERPLFWYEREHLDDLPWPPTPLEAQKQLETRNRIFDELRDRHGVTLIDTLRPLNWGVRPGSSTPVFRDLSCAIAPGHDTISGPPARRRKGNRTPTGLGRKLRKLIYTNDLMGEFWFADTWVAGGCWSLAQALLKWLTPEYGRIVSLVSGKELDRPQHLVVEVRTPEGPAYLDGDGLQYRRKLLGLWLSQEGVRAPRLVPFVEADARATCNVEEDRVDALLPDVLAQLGRPEDWDLRPLDTPRDLRGLQGDVQQALLELPVEKDGNAPILPRTHIEVRVAPDGKVLNASVSDSFARYDEVKQALESAAPAMTVVVTDEGGFPPDYRKVFP